MSHTPGPWIVAEGLRSNETRVWAKEVSSRIALVSHRALHDTRSGKGKAGPSLPHEANARLIAAAPALVAACEKAKRALETIKATGKIDWKLVDVGYGITELSAALALAKGE